MSQKKSTRRKCKRAHQRAAEVLAILAGLDLDAQSTEMQAREHQALRRLRQKVLHDPGRLIAEGGEAAVRGAAIGAANDLKQYEVEATPFDEAVQRQVNDRCDSAVKTLAVAIERLTGSDGGLRSVQTGRADLNAETWKELDVWAKTIVLGRKGTRTV